MPVPPPVTTATLPSSSAIACLLALRLRLSSRCRIVGAFTSTAADPARRRPGSQERIKRGSDLPS
jgi:hypothetical protein